MFHPLELSVYIVPLTNIPDDVIPRELGGAVVFQLGVILQVVDWAGKWVEGVVVT